MLQAAVIDVLAFASSAAVIEGRLGMASLPRLAESGGSSSGLRFVLAGETNERGRPGLRLLVEGRLCIVCQRCLGSLDFPLQLQAHLELAASDAEIAAADDDIDRIVAAREMSVAALVEDEVLLALPMVPRHERCAPAAGWEEDAKPSAFQALASLKRSNK